MSKINKIKLSGTTYDVEDANASKTVELTQAQYDALSVKDPNTFYIITDGETFDPSSKADTSAFTAHTGDSTIHVTSSEKSTWNAKSDFSGSYNDLTDKPTIPTVPTSNTAFTNDAQYATSGYVDSAVSGKANSSDVYTKSETSGATQISDALSGKLDTTAYTPTDLSNYYQKSETSGATQISDALSGKVETSAITSAVTSASTDNEIPTAKAVFDAIPTGSSITIESAITSGSTNAVEGGAIYDAVNAPEYPIEGALSSKHFWDDENMGCYTEISDSTRIKVPNSTLLSYPYIAYAFADDSEFMGGGVGYVATVTSGAISDLQMLNGSSISSLTATYDGSYTYFTPSGGTFSVDNIGVIAVMGMDYEPMDFMDLGQTAIENGADVGIISVVGSISAETLVNRVNRIYDDVGRLETFNPIADTITLNDNDGDGRNLDGIGYGILNYNTYNPLTDKTASGHTADIFKYSTIDFKNENNVLTFNGSVISMDALKNRGPAATISEFTDGSSATTDQYNSLFGYDSCFIINTNSASSGGSNQSMSIEISGPNSKSGNIQLQLDNSKGLTVQVSYNDNSVSKTIKPFVLGNSYIIDTRKAGGWGDETGIHTLTVSNWQGSDFISSIKFYGTYNATIPIADIAADVAAGTYARKNEMFDELSHLAMEEEVNFYDYGSPSAVTISTGLTVIRDFYGIVISGMSEGFFINVRTDDAIGKYVDGLEIGSDGNITSTEFPDEPIPYYLDDEITKFENGVWNIYFAEGTKANYMSINTATEASAVIYKSFTETPIKDAVSSIQNSLSGYVETSAITSAVTSASTDNEIPTAKAVYDAIPQGGGGKAISAGTNISITTGETADTINCTLNISNGTGGLSIKSNGASSASANHTAAFGQNTKATNVCAFAEGWGTTASGGKSHSEGDQTVAGGGQSHAEGTLTKAMADHSHSEGYASSATSRVTTMVGITTPYGWNTRHSEGYATIADNGCTHTEGLSTKALNVAEHSSGAYNVSYTASTTWGDSGNTLFSVGNGTAEDARHNAFEIRQNGDIYLNDGTNDVKLQDTITATAANTTALGGLKLVKLTQTEYDNLGTKDSNTLYVITTS